MNLDLILSIMMILGAVCMIAATITFLLEIYHPYTMSKVNDFVFDHGHKFVYGGGILIIVAFAIEIVRLVL